MLEKNGYISLKVKLYWGKKNKNDLSFHSILTHYFAMAFLCVGF